MFLFFQLRSAGITTRRRVCLPPASRSVSPSSSPSSPAWTPSTRTRLKSHVVVVYHVTIVAIGHGLLKKFWPLVLGCVLRTAVSSIIWNYADPLTSLELLNYYLTLAMSSGIVVLDPGKTFLTSFTWICHLFNCSRFNKKLI